MPDKRNRMSKLSTYKTKRRNFRAKASAIRQIQALQSRANRRTGGYIGIEKKFRDTRVGDDAFTVTWAGGEMDPTGDTVSGVDEGVGESQRIGRVYFIHEIYVNGWVNIPAVESASGPAADVRLRFALVLDKQTNGIQLQAEDVFKAIGSGLDMNSYRNLQFVQRFDVLADKRMLMPVTTADLNEGAINLFAHGHVTRFFKMSHKFKEPLKVTCTGTTSAVASISDNSIHVIGTASSIVAQMDYECRMQFTD